MENQVREYKSLQIITGGRFKELAEECVGFANAQGGVIVVGVEDKTKEPPNNQRIEQKILNNTLERLRRLTYFNCRNTKNFIEHGKRKNNFISRV